MGQRHSIIAFLAVIAAIVTLSLVGADQGQIDSQVFSNAIVGLVGIAGSFRPKSSEGNAPQ